MAESKRKIEYRKIDELVPYVNNPRNNDSAVDKVAASIAEFGFNVPIVIDKNNIIVTGHTRYKAAQKLKIKEVPTIQVDDLTEAQVKAFRLADNKTGEFAEWDFELLAKELDDLKLVDDFNMEDFGFIDNNEDLGLFDIMENNDFSSAGENVANEFSVTFNFNIELKPKFEEYFKEHGKKLITQYIIDEVSKNA